MRGLCSVDCSVTGATGSAPAAVGLDAIGTCVVSSGKFAMCVCEGASGGLSTISFFCFCCGR